MEKFQEKAPEDQDMDIADDDLETRHQKPGGGTMPRAKSGTISGMLEEFTRALGLPGTSPVEDAGMKVTALPTSLAISPITNITAVSSLQKEYQVSRFC